VPRAFALVRRPGGVGELPLEAREAALFRLLLELPVAEALATLEAACPADERSLLPVKARAWLSRSVALDFWSGADFDQK
jgi:hypothetical protein